MSNRSQSGPSERARDSALREFLAPGATPEGARLEEAERDLGAMLERELGVPIEDEERFPASRHRARPGRPGRSGTMWALAATIALVAGASWIALMRPGGERVMRGTTSPTRPGGWDARAAAEPTEDGDVRLVWRKATGATSYTVVFLSADLSELARVSARTDTSLLLAKAGRPPTLPAGTEGLWRVEAYAGRDEIGRSPALPIAFP